MNILIQQYQFEVSEPFSAGHVLSEDEARAFNEHRARGIVYNVQKEVQRLTKKLPEGELLGDSVLSELQLLISEYDLRYSYKTTISRRIGAIELASEEIARLEVEAELRAKRERVHDYVFLRLVAERSAIKETRDKARVLLKARQKVAKGLLEREMEW